MIYRKMILFFLIKLCFTVIQVRAETCNQSTPFQNLKDVTDKATCSELPVGKSIIVNFDRSNSPTKVPHKYELMRIAPDEYKVRLNIRLRENTFLVRENTELTDQMRAKIQKCLEWINPHLLGPDDKKFEIELIDPIQSKIQKYEEIENWIAVSEEKIPRENSAFYSLQSSCPTIAHELLHLMGLVDEYAELIDISSYQKECRSLGPEDSIMSHHNEATDFSNEFPRKIFISCCICKDNNCKEITESDAKVLKTCPAEYDKINTYVKYSKEGTSLEHTNNQMVCSSLAGGFGFMGMNNQKKSFLLSERPSGRIRDSFLYPAQFRSIIFPGCKEKNQTYYSCSRDSHFRPFKIFNCNSKPNVCQDELDWLK